MTKYKVAKEQHWKAMFRKEAFFEQSKRCKYCKSELSLVESTADHRIPRSKGGQTTRENIALCCEPCNRAKGSISESLFLNMIKKPPAVGADFRIMRAWMRRKIAVQALRSIKNIETMFIGEENAVL